ncbi:MAG TPA: PDZ domain-containing protein [Candidatus Polarisedimenticolia bacterium]|nr:PDZ domain-containing protein [Candidatus Polarisedimenticolia bacterium]
MRAPAPPAAPATPEADDDDRHKKRGWLGVFLDEDEDGVRITGIKEGSPAEKAGLREGDKIVEVDNKPIEDDGDIRRIIRSLEPGDHVQIEVMRDGKRKTVTATLGEAKEVWHEGGFPGWGQAMDPGQWQMFGVSRTYLGVRVQGMTEELRTYFKAPRGRGVLISRVEEDTPAGKAGLRAGDVIIAVDGKGIAAQGDIGSALSDREPGDTVAVKIVRDGVEKTIDVEVAERPEHKRHGSLMAPTPHPHHDQGWADEDDDQDNLEIEDLDDAPDDGRMQMQYRRALEEAHRALAESMMQRDEVQRQIKRELENAMRQTELARVDPEAIKMQIRAQMDQAREQMRQAAEELRRARILQYEDNGI